MKTVLAATLLAVLSLFGGCATQQIVNEPVVFRDVAATRAQVEPGKCVQSRMATANYGIRVYSVVSVVNDTQDVFVLSASGTGLMLKDTPVCPNGGRLEFLVPHPLTDSYSNNAVIRWTSVVPEGTKDAYGQLIRVRTGNQTLTVGGPQGYATVLRASSAWAAY